MDGGAFVGEREHPDPRIDPDGIGNQGLPLDQVQAHAQPAVAQEADPRQRTALQTGARVERCALSQTGCPLSVPRQPRNVLHFGCGRCAQCRVRLHLGCDQEQAVGFQRACVDLHMCRHTKPPFTAVAATTAQAAPRASRRHRGPAGSSAPGASHPSHGPHGPRSVRYAGPGHGVPDR